MYDKNDADDQITAMDTNFNKVVSKKEERTALTAPFCDVFYENALKFPLAW